MKVYRSEKHALHFPKGELYGGELVRPFECPERWDYVMDRLSERGYEDFSEPAEFDIDLVQRVHTPTSSSFWKLHGTFGKRKA